MRGLTTFVLMPLTIIGALNWGLIGIFGFDLVAFIFGPATIASSIVYSIIGIAALVWLIWMIIDRPVRRTAWAEAVCPRRRWGPDCTPGNQDLCCPLCRGQRRSIAPACSFRWSALRFPRRPQRQLATPLPPCTVPLSVRIIFVSSMILLWVWAFTLFNSAQAPSSFS